MLKKYGEPQYLALGVGKIPDPIRPEIFRVQVGSGCDSNPIGWELVNPTQSEYPIGSPKEKKNLTHLHTLHTHTPDTVRQAHTVTITNTQKNRLTHTQHNPQ